MQLFVFGSFHQTTGATKQAVAGRRRHVPYRDHKLTNLLRDAVGGTAKVLMHLGAICIAVLDSLMLLASLVSTRDDAMIHHLGMGTTEPGLLPLMLRSD